MDKKKILVVEDEKTIADILVFNLGREGYDTMAAYDGAEGLHKALTESPDLILLDVMLPEMDGFEVCRRVRAQSDIPIIMLTAREEEADKVMGLELGADDYITKPFSMRELMARVKTNLRRANLFVSALGGFTVDRNTYRAFYNGQDLGLTLKEYKLLALLLGKAGMTVDRDTLFRSVWGEDYVGETRTLDMHIATLREKIKEAGGYDAIVTVRGIGYRFESKQAE